MAHHLLRLPDAWFTARHPGDVLSRFNSIPPIRDFLISGAFAMLVDTIMAVGAFSVLLLLGASQVIAGAFALGMLFAFNSFGGMFAARVHSLVRALLDMRMLKLHRERIADIGLEQREVPPGMHGIRSELRGAVSVRSLSYAYNVEEGAVLQGFNLNFAPGEFMVVSDESGAGKSTLTKLLTKLLTPDEGDIQIDGNDLRLLDTAHYRRQLGVVMQDDDLLSGSLLENIAVGDARPDLARAAQAARLACIDEDIRRMPMQYLTLVGHRGSSLSGGQRQRVMIARAVYRQPRILLLDEGTAHLNDTLQRRVLANLAALCITMIAVTHDPRVLEYADRSVRI